MDELRNERSRARARYNETGSDRDWERYTSLRDEARALRVPWWEAEARSGGEASFTAHEYDRPVNKAEPVRCEFDRRAPDGTVYTAAGWPYCCGRSRTDDRFRAREIEYETGRDPVTEVRISGLDIHGIQRAEVWTPAGGWREVSP